MPLKYYCIGIISLLTILVLLYSPTVFHSRESESAKQSPLASVQKKQIFPLELGSKKELVTIKATTHPQFIVNLMDNKFKNLWTAKAKERNSFINATITTPKDNSKLILYTTLNDEKKQLTVEPLIENKLKPGLYTLDIKVKAVDGSDVTVTQDFAWGVMAINTNKGIYRVGEKVSIGMAVLGDYGNTKCIAKGNITFNTAKIWLRIVSPSGVEKNLSTDDNSIIGSKECADRSVTNTADFQTFFTGQETGEYTIYMEAEHIFGKRRMTYTFQVVQNIAAFDVERTKYPTRIYPKVDYPVSITIKTSQDYIGTVSDYIPKNFQIYSISDLGQAQQQDTFQEIQWQVNWKKDMTYTLSYTIHFPPVAPELYLIGPVTIGHYSEQHQWKIASDSIFQLVQEAHNTNTGTSVSATLPSSVTQNHLVLKICYRTTNSSFSSQSGWTTAYNNSSGPRIYMFYRIAPSGLSSTVTCSTTSSGNIAIQVLEFSGNSTSSVRDQRNRLNNSTTCNSGAHQNTNSNLTPGNPDVLVVSAFSATATRTVTSHTNYTDSSVSFNGSTGTFDSSWSEVVNNPPIATKDAVTYSAGGGTCDNLQVSFNPTISVSQGGYRFFENANDITPGNPLATQGTSIQNVLYRYPFRLRILLDVDSPSGSTIGIDSGDWQLEYAEMPSSGDCADGTYAPVDTIANDTPIAFNPNSNSGGNNAIIFNSGNDPTDVGYTNVYEDYIETWLDDSTEDITNHQAILANNQAGVFDFSLINNFNDLHAKTFCLAVFNGDGSALDVYKNYPTITTAQTDVLIQGGTTFRGGSIMQ